MKYCKRCYQSIIDDEMAKSGNQTNTKIEPKDYMCQIPLYDHASSGEPLVRVWDCRIQLELTLTPKQYESWKADYDYFLDQENGATGATGA
jgi:hypothetical protein